MKRFHTIKIIADMKKHILGIIVITLLILVGTNDSFAQQTSKETLTPEQQRELRKQSRHKSYISVWQKRLELTDEQVAAIKPAYEKYATAVRAIKIDTELTHNEKKAASISLREEYDAEFRTHLTTEQKEKLDGFSNRKNGTHNSKK